MYTVSIKKLSGTVALSLIASTMVIGSEQAWAIAGVSPPQGSNYVAVVPAGPKKDDGSTITTVTACNNSKKRGSCTESTWGGGESRKHVCAMGNKAGLCDETLTPAPKLYPASEYIQDSNPPKWKSSIDFRKECCGTKAQNVSEEIESFNGGLSFSPGYIIQ